MARNLGDDDIFDSIVMADERWVFWKKLVVCMQLLVGSVCYQKMKTSNYFCLSLCVSCKPLLKNTMSLT